MVSSTNIVRKIKKIVKGKVPSAKVYLYGSRAKGTSRDNSDWDILILLKDNILTSELETEISYSLFDLEIETGEIISPMIYSEKDWNRKYSVAPFYKNLMKDMLLL